MFVAQEMTIQKLRMKIDFYEIKKFLRNMISIPTFFFYEHFESIQNNIVKGDV